MGPGTETVKAEGESLVVLLGNSLSDTEGYAQVRSKKSFSFERCA